MHSSSSCSRVTSPEERAQAFCGLVPKGTKFKISEEKLYKTALFIETKLEQLVQQGIFEVEKGPECRYPITIDPTTKRAFIHIKYAYPQGTERVFNRAHREIIGDTEEVTVTIPALCYDSTKPTIVFITVITKRPLKSEIFQDRAKSV